MPFKTIICGAILIALGLIGYQQATPDDQGKVSPTALIPAGLGGGLVLMGIMGFKPGARKHAMHMAAMVALVGILGGFMPIVRQQMKDKPFEFTLPVISGLAMSLVCVVFLYLCVKSFIDARKARKAAAA